MDAIKIYKALSKPPADALKTIQAGKLKGKSDINPQWRYKAMTEMFGLVGIGWKYDIQKLWTEQGGAGEVLAFAQVAVYVKDPQTSAWSEPIIGVGGSKLVQLEHDKPVSNDEGYKMAVTDAFSTALKMLGVAAAIYAGLWDGSKYKDAEQKPNGAGLTEEQKEEMAKWKDGTFTKEELDKFKADWVKPGAAERFEKMKAEYEKRKAGTPSAEAEKGASDAFDLY